MATEHNEQQPQRAFKVEDRRRFTASGDPRPDLQDQPATERENKPEQTSKDPGFRMEPPPPPPAINFATFVLSLSTQALAHLGEIPDPVTREIRRDLAAASQMIDILAMIEQKTRGNLEPDEAQLLSDILYDLRLRYVEKSKS
ncbi:MAG: hypothetical protein KatS3mg077_0744 [Candidatus Binatia bacterium]|nr:MAG: hypothetical protein KatS3mg077_0744 [Candidatus Binatia bacterium]